MSPVFHKRLARQVELHLDSEVEGVESPFDACSLLEQVRAAMKSKRSLAPARKRKAAKLRSKKSETGDIRAAVFERSGGRCEACKCWLARELEHCFGRKLVPQKVSNCMALCRPCHRERTSNIPSAWHWWDIYARHFRAYGYHQEQSMAEALAEKHRVKAELQGRAS